MSTQSIPDMAASLVGAVARTEMAIALLKDADGDWTPLHMLRMQAEEVARNGLRDAWALLGFIESAANYAAASIGEKK